MTSFFIALSECGIGAPLINPVSFLLQPGQAISQIIENDHVIIIRNGERYDITGKKL